jgi:8-oxo-dGTP pyrophosphatase MutT (NUDIX family)
MKWRGDSLRVAPLFVVWFEWLQLTIIVNMNHEISAGAIVMDGERVLLVRHCKPGEYDFLVLPGGVVNPNEDALAAAKREVWEETGLTVEPLHLAYVDETRSEETRACKMWFYCKGFSGTLSVAAHEAQREYIVEANFYSRAEIQGKVAFPPPLFTDEFWQNASQDFPQTEYLGLRELEF